MQFPDLLLLYGFAVILLSFRDIALPLHISPEARTLLKIETREINYRLSCSSVSPYGNKQEIKCGSQQRAIDGN